MNILQELLSSDLLHRLGWVLLHSLWQFALIAITLAVVLELSRSRSAETRYNLCCVALAGALLTSGVTFAFMTDLPSDGIASVEPTTKPTVVAPNETRETLPPVAAVELAPPRVPSFPHIEASPPNVQPPQPAPVVTSPKTTIAPQDTAANIPPLGERFSATIQPWLPGTSLAWLCGVLLLSLWNTGGWLGVIRLRRIGTSPVGQEITDRVEALAAQLKLRQAVRVMQSALVEVPVVIGWWRPVLLMPVGIITGLSPGQLDALLAHELTHVRRFDYLVNLIQTLIETVLFYHPAIWWMSRRIRVEREYCCDDAAIRLCGDGLEYATVLASFEQARSAPRPAVAASDGNTLSRVRRILGVNAPTRRLTKSLAGSLALVTIAASLMACFLQTGTESAAATPASKPTTFVKAEISQSFDADGIFLEKPRKFTITDANALKQLKAHFPQVDTGRTSDIAAGWESSAVIRFHRQDGKTVRVATNFEDWSEGQGDWKVKGDLAGFFKKQLATKDQAQPKADAILSKFESIQWRRFGIRGEGKLTLHADGTFELIHTRRIATGRNPQFKETQPANGSDELGPDAIDDEPLPPEAFILRDQKTRRTGKWRLLHPGLQLIALDEKDTTSGMRLYQIPAEKAEWRYEPVMLTQKVSSLARSNWLRVTPNTLAEISALAPFRGEKPLKNLPEMTSKYSKLIPNVHPQTVARLTKILPPGWSLFVAGDSLLLTHDSPIEVEYIYPSAPDTTVAESWNEISEERIHIQLQLFPRIAPDKRLARAGQLQDQIDGLAKQMVSFQDPPGRKPSLWGYNPRTDAQRKLLDQYVQATRTRNALPDYYGIHHSLELNPSLFGSNYITNQQVDKQLYDLVVAAKLLFRPYSATEDRDVSNAQQALILAAIRTTAAQTGVGQQTTGLDLSKHLELSDQQKDLDAFTNDHRYFDRDVSRLVKLKKTWALCALLDHNNVDANILAARGLGNLADPLSVPVLLAAAKRNNYFVVGSESATLHMIYRTTLKQALETIIDQPLTPPGLRVTVYPGTRAGRTIRSEDEPSYFKEQVDFNKVQLWLQVHQPSPQAAWLTPSQSQAIQQLVSHADGIVLIEQTSGAPAKIIKTYKGSYKTETLSPDLQRILTSHPAGLEGPRWFLFMREESSDIFLQVAPAVENPNHWLIAASPLLTASIEQLVPLPKHWSEPVKDVSIGLRARHPIVSKPEHLAVEVVLRSGKQTGLWNHRYNIYDYWPFTTFEVIAPDGTQFLLSKPAGPIREDDHPHKRSLSPGTHYIHAFQLSDWGVSQPGKPVPGQSDQQRAEANAQAFAKPGIYTLRAIYEVKHKRGDADFIGRLVSPPVILQVVAVPKPKEIKEALGVKARLLDSLIWPGESPRFELEIQNHSDQPVSLIKQDKLTNYTAIHVKTLDSNGKDVPGWHPHADPRGVPIPEQVKLDSFSLARGAKTTMVFDSLTRPRIAGQYTMHVTYLASGKRHELKVPYKVVNIDADDIMSRFGDSLDKSYGNFAGDRWEVLKVKTNGQYQAVLRHFNNDVPGVEACYRLFDVDNDAALLTRFTTTKKPATQDYSIFAIYFQLDYQQEGQTKTTWVNWHGEVTPKAPTGLFPPNSFKGVSLQLTIPRKQRTTENISADLTLSNHSRQALFFNNWYGSLDEIGRRGNVQLVVLDEKGQLAKYIHFEQRKLMSVDFARTSIAAGKSVTLKITLDKWHDISKPGTYSVHAIYTSHGPFQTNDLVPMWVGQLASNTVQLTVRKRHNLGNNGLEADKSEPAAAQETNDATGLIINGLHIKTAPSKLEFKPSDDVYLNVTVTNTSDTSRYLGICPSYKHDEGQRATTVHIQGRRQKIDGIPGYVLVRADQGWDVRLGANGYSDKYDKSIEIQPGKTATFQVEIPKLGDNTTRPTGRLETFSRFSVSKSADGLRTIANGPEAIALIVDQAKLSQGVATLKGALAGKAKKTHEIENAIRAIADNPAPEHVELVAKVVGHPWPGRQHIQWNLWYAASKYVDPAIYKLAVAEAKNPKLGVGSASLVYNTIYRNRQYLTRADALQIVNNPLLQSTDFTRTNNNGFWPTILLATVAKQQDIPLLGDLCGKFIPPRIGHDLTHASMPNRGLEPIHAAFMRHPEASRIALRKVLGQGRVPGEFEPWAHEFSIGLVPKSLVLMAQWSAELNDTQSIPLLEHYATTELVRVTNSMQTEAPKLIAAIDGPEAMKALRRISPRGMPERAKLGDPVAIDTLLALARALHGSRDDDTGQAHSTFALVFSIMNPNQKVTYEDVRDGVPVEQQWKARRAGFAKAFTTKYGFDPDGVEVEKRAEIPAHLRHWPGLSDRIDGKIVNATPADVRVAKGYAKFASKGKLHKGRRVTIMTARKEYPVGEEVRVIHVLEAVEPGDEIYVMGPKAVYDEYLDGTRVTKDAPGLSAYNGRVLNSPAVDYNYAITKYKFDAPGKHTIQWKTAGPFDGGKLESNLLQITVVPLKQDKPVEGVQLKLRADAETWTAGVTPTFQIDIHNNGPKTWALPPSQPLYEIEVDGTWYQWTGPISVISPLVKPEKGLSNIPLSADGRFFQQIQQTPGDVKLIPLKFTPGEHTVRVACSPDPEDATKTKRVRVVSNRVTINVVLSEKDILGAVKRQLALEADPKIVKKAKRPELQLPFLRTTYEKTEIWEVAVGIKPPLKFDPPINGMRAFVGPQGEILKLQTTPATRRPLKPEIAEKSLTARGYTLCTLPVTHQLPLKKLLHQRQDHTFWTGDPQGKQQLEVFFATHEGNKEIICLFLLRGYQLMISPPPMIVDGKPKESPLVSVVTAWLIPYNLDTGQWEGRESFPDEADELAP